MRTLTFGFECVGEMYPASVSLPDEYFTPEGVPKWHLLNSRFSSPIIHWRPVIGVVEPDGVVVEINQRPSVSQELQLLKDTVRLLEAKLGVGQ